MKLEKNSIIAWSVVIVVLYAVPYIGFRVAEDNKPQAPRIQEHKRALGLPGPVILKSDQVVCYSEGDYRDFSQATGTNDLPALKWLKETTCFMTQAEIVATILSTSWGGISTLRVYNDKGSASLIWTSYKNTRYY